MLTLPHQFKARSAFVGVAFLSAIVASLIWLVSIKFIFLFGMDHDKPLFRIPSFSELGLIVLFSISSIPAAFICWPNDGRTLKRMLLAGFLTVGVSFSILGWAVSIFMVGGSVIQGQSMSLEDLLSAVLMGPIFVLFGTIFTVGIPYLVGLLVASLFADDRSSGDI